MSALGDELGGSYPKSFKGHKGMLRSARNLVERLVTSGLLDKAYSNGVGTEMITPIMSLFLDEIGTQSYSAVFYCIFCIILV